MGAERACRRMRWESKMKEKRVQNSGARVHFSAGNLHSSLRVFDSVKWRKVVLKALK